MLDVWGMILGYLGYDSMFGMLLKIFTRLLFYTDHCQLEKPWGKKT